MVMAVSETEKITQWGWVFKTTTIPQDFDGTWRVAGFGQHMQGK